MISALQSLRFVFVMMIFMSHFSYGGLMPFDAGGDCGVAFFFLLSGFVLTLGYGPKIEQGTFNFGSFMRRRLLKVLPLHWLTLLAFLLLSHAAIGWPVVLNALLLQSWVPLREVYFSCNAVSWFLSCMLFCYMAFPWLYRHASLTLLALVLALCTVAYAVVPYDRVTDVLYVSPIVRSADFFMGIMLARLFRSRRCPAPPPWTELLVVALLVAAILAYPHADAKWRNAPLFWVALIPLIFVFAHERGWLSRMLGSRPMQMLGALSMPVFLLHPMVVSAVLRRLPTLHYTVALAVCLAVVLTVSWGIDRFLLRHVDRLCSKQAI